MIRYMILWSIVTLSSHAFAGGFVIIGHSSIGDAGLSKSDVLALYMGTKKAWGNGTKVKLCQIDANLGDFLSSIGGDKKAYSKFWKKALFTGAGTAPSKKSSAADALKFVTSTEGGACFVPAGSSTAGAKVLFGG